METIKLRKILIDIYEYLSRTPEALSKGVSYEEITKFLMTKYDGTKEKVELRLDELKKLKLIQDMPDSVNGDKFFQITAQGYKIRRSLLATFVFLLFG